MTSITNYEPADIAVHQGQFADVHVAGLKLGNHIIAVSDITLIGIAPLFHRLVAAHTSGLLQDDGGQSPLPAAQALDVGGNQTCQVASLTGA